MKKPIQYTVTIGCIGEGQLARMMVLAGRKLGIRVKVLGPKFPSSCSRLTDQIRLPYSDQAGLTDLASGTNVVTYEFENVPAMAVEYLEAKGINIFPPVSALITSQNRLKEKNLFWDLKLNPVTFADIESYEDLQRQLLRTPDQTTSKYPIILPAILKTKTGGYDGKGQYVIKKSTFLGEAWSFVGGEPCILEGMIKFDRELSIIAVRGTKHQTVFYPVVQNFHHRGMLRLSLAPAPSLPPELQVAAEGMAKKILDKFNYIGVMALEMFQCGNDLMASEIAPRVHNSGHWTIEAAPRRCQFSNHLLAVTGEPLRSTEISGCWAMVNMIGGHEFGAVRALPEEFEVKALIPDAKYHRYGKGRRRHVTKLGHITIHANDYGQLVKKIELLRGLPGIWLPNTIL